MQLLDLTKETLASMRPRRWLKNLAFFAPLLFSNNLTDSLLFGLSLAGFFILCMVSGALYLINDIFDLADDRKHPDKRLRPIADGRLSTQLALATALSLIGASLIFSLLIDPHFGSWLVGYLILGIIYSAWLKKLAIVDLFSQAFLFLFRIIAGAVLIQVPISRWLLICSLLLSLFIVLSRKRYELTSEKTPADLTRSAHYSPYLIDQMVAVVTSATLIAYTLYTFAPATTAKFGGQHLILTTPFVLYGIFRYLYLVFQKESANSPEREIFLDRPFLVNSFLYLIVTVMVLYFV